MKHNPQCLRPDHYFHYSRITTRWIDNDLYGHINNVNYYQFFDTVVNEYLIEHAGLKIHTDQIVAYVVASSCQYLSPISHPDIVHAGLRVNHLGSRSVEYGVGIFRGLQLDTDNAIPVTPETPQASAYGTFTHVYVNRQQGAPVAIPQTARRALEVIS